MEYIFKQQEKIDVSEGINEKIYRRKKKLNEQYNKQLSPQDSEKTSFIYTKILVKYFLQKAIEFIIALFSVITIVVSLMLEFDMIAFISADRAKYLINIFTLLTIIAIFLQARCRIKWNSQKGASQLNTANQYIWWILQSLMILPSPNLWITGEMQVYDFATKNQITIKIDSILTIYVLMRTGYILKFLIHSESYYGSRPDRLSRIYTVKFGTSNAIRYLTNQQPVETLLILYLINMLQLPLALYIIEGPINQSYHTYLSCVYNSIISLSTVGYGDTYSITPIGRTIEVIIILMGITLTSLVMIFVIQSLTFTSVQQQSHYLYRKLKLNQQIQKALVRRIEQEWKTSRLRCPALEKKQKMDELKSFRLQNRRMLNASANQPSNLKRLMLRNFAQLSQQVQFCKVKQQLLIQYCQVMMGSTITQSYMNDRRISIIKKTNDYKKLEEKIINKNFETI